MISDMKIYPSTDKSSCFNGVKDEDEYNVDCSKGDNGVCRKCGE